MTNEPHCSIQGAAHHDTDQMGLPAGFRGAEREFDVVAGRVAVRDLVEPQKVLQALSKQPRETIGVTSQLHSVVSALVEASPELQALYDQVKASQTSGEVLLSVATFGFKPSPVRRFECELGKAVDEVVEQLKQQGLVAVDVDGSIPYVTVGARTACGDGPPIIVTTIWITEAGRRALEESEKVQQTGA